MAEWIHVVTATKVPSPRASTFSPFETYSDAFNPNGSSPFGAAYPSMFLPVVYVAEPAINTVLQKTAVVSTTGTNGASYSGHYVAPNWVIEYVVGNQDLAKAKELKLAALYAARDAAIAAGYVSGSFVFPLTEEFHALLNDRYNFLTLAIAEGAVPANRKLTFSDVNGVEVSVGIAALKTNHVAFGVAYLTISEKAVKARSEIAAATTVAAVNAVTWSF